jgi:hypothetical protein
MLIGNKKVSQLLQLGPGEVAPDDLLLIIDTSQRESKNIYASDFAAWLNASGSVYAVHAILADTASYVSGNSVFGPVASAAFALVATSASWANNSYHATYADSASISQTASFALNAQGLSITSSYLLYQGFPNGTSSFALNVEAANTANTAAFLLYYGGNNGTASYAILAQSTSFCDTANTASYFNNAIGVVASASLAIFAYLASQSLAADTASYLQYSGVDNGTASYALVSAIVGGSSMFAYGMVEAHYQSISASVIENLTVTPSQIGRYRTLIEANGSVILNFTASVQNDYSLSLTRFNRLNGEYAVMDAETIGFDTTPILNMWGTNATGSLKIPFTLVKQEELNGEYLIEVTSSSPNLQLDTSRLVKYTITSASDFVDSFFDSPIIFDIQPSQSVNINFTSSTTPTQVTHDQLPGLLITGSQNITDIDISNQGVTSVRYTWKCSSLRKFNCNENSITNLKYAWPASLQRLECNDNILSLVADLDNTTASYIDISFNGITTSPKLSPSTSYFDLSFNPITILPDLPISLRSLNAKATLLNGLVGFLPNSLYSASFANTSVTSLFNLPISMSYLSLASTFVPTTSMDLPPSMSYLDISFGVFGNTALENMSTNLDSNGIMSGSFLMPGYGPPSTTTLINNILSLQSKGWNVSYDL